ncbi:MAG: diguanylate cyclase [Acidimicrobiales bacterium]
MVDAHSLLELLPDVVFIIDATGVITYINGAIRDAGWEPDDVVGRNAFELVHPDDLGLALGAFARTSGRPGRAVPIELRVLARNGTWRTFEIVADNQLEEPLAGVLVSGRDLSDRALFDRAVHHDPELLRALVNRVADLLLFVDADGRIAYANAALTRTLGYDPEDALGMRFIELIGPGAGDEASFALSRLLRTPGESVVVEVPLRRATGGVVPMEISGTNQVADKVIGGSVLTARDLRGGRRAEEEFRSVLETLEEAFIVFDEAGDLQFANVAAKRHFWWALRRAGLARVDDPSAGAQADTALHALVARLVDEQGAPLSPLSSPPVLAVLDGVPFDSMTVGVQRPDHDEPTWMMLRGAVLDVDGRRQSVLSGFDITARKRLEDQLRASEQRYRALSLHDPLTGLANNRLVDERLLEALAAPLLAGILFIDLDRFKDLNDTFGHTVGDQVLCEIAERLRRVVRAGDTPGRRGGDEFVVVCAGLAGPTELEALAARLTEVLRDPVPLDDGTVVQPSASIGGSIQSPGLDTPDAMLQAADAAVYAVKAAGRNGWQLGMHT